jgi:hypothetical protein
VSTKVSTQVSGAGLSALVAAALLALTSVQAQAESSRFAVFVGSNLGDRHEPVLHHAEDDSARLAQTMRTLGDFPADQVVVMNAVTAPELRDAIIRLNARVRELHDGVLMVFYSGHADAESLHLAGTHLSLSELKALLVGSPATSRVLVVDACRSGSLISLKGAKPATPFNVTAVDLGNPEGFAVLASSTATENAQESIALGGSFFTYYLNSGLIGAADQNRDGAVTLSEAYAFASAETRAATASSPAGPQTPTFQFMLGGQHDLILTRPGRHDVRFGQLQFAGAGRYVVQRWEPAGLSPPLAEVGAHEPGATLAVPPGRYRVTLRGSREISERDATVTGGETTVVTPANMTHVDLGRVVRKGGVRNSATGLALAAGWRTNDFGRTQLSLGSGPMLQASLRHDRRSFSLEARLGLEQAVISDASYDLQNTGLSLTAGLLFPIDWKRVTLSLGFEVGMIMNRQKGVPRAEEPLNEIAPADPDLIKARWSNGMQLGPLAQLDFPLSENVYMRLGAALPFQTFGDYPPWPTEFHAHGPHLQLTAGAGITF